MTATATDSVQQIWQSALIMCDNADAFYSCLVGFFQWHEDSGAFLSLGERRIP